MRKLPPKEATEIPVSLALPASLSNDTDGRTKRKAKTTQERRKELIEAGAYLDQDIYNSRYKEDDTKKAIKDHYKGKCAFCEQKVEAFHVEHYRPKSIYYWLAYSWDNLLYACSICNQHKGDKFEIQGTKVAYQPNHLPEIHSLCEKYNAIEQPKLLHPEFDDFEEIWEFTWEFDDKGKIRVKIKSNDIRGKYTIETCCLDRLELNKFRGEVLKEFMEELNVIQILHPSNEFNMLLSKLLENFGQKARNTENSFLAFRNYALEYIVPNILQKLLT